MTQDTSITELVLGYCRQVGGLVEPPAYGIYEILLPEDVAARWGIEPLQHLTFEAANRQDGVTYLHYGHALVETIVNELHWQSANGLFYINHVRPEKPGLYPAIEKALSFPNAKLFPVPAATEQIRLHHYIRFNFKASLIADEKREFILPVWMDVQNGYPVKGADIERLALLETENLYQNTPPAATFWSNEPPLASKTVSTLLDRASQAVADELGETLGHMQKRLKRYLELDRARLNEYYSDLLKDGERRLQKAEADHRPVLEAKIAAITAERETKLADVEQKYHLQLQVELLNLAVITLPKLDLTVEIRMRTSVARRMVSWNPLLHIVEPLACDVCSQSGMTLLLCENGHLAHAECLAPQCVSCKRIYCQKCAHEVQTCAVCERPVCVHSLTRCATCLRVTCSEHVGECHAVNGGPRTVTQIQEKPVIITATSEDRAAPLKTGSPLKTGTAQKRQAPEAKTSLKKINPTKPLADYLEIYADPADGTITAYIIARKRELATRRWRMTDEGIAVMCHCEKPDCDQRGIVYRPGGDIEEQMKYLLNKFQAEYHLPDNKVRYFQIRKGRPFEEKKLMVPSNWKDPDTLKRAREGFGKLRNRR